MAKINVLFVMIQMEMGGTERLIYNLVRELDRKAFNSSVAWFVGPRALTEFKDLQVPLYHIPKTRKIDFRAMGALEEVIRKNGIDIVNAHHFMSVVYAFYGSKIKNQSTLVYTEHSEWEIEQISWKWKAMGRYLLNQTDATVGVSRQVSKRIQQNFKIRESKAITIENGVDITEFDKKTDKIALRKEIGLSAHDNVIGVVANFRKIKNHLFLLRAFSRLIKECSNAKLLLIGKGFKYDLENSEQEIRDFVNEERLDKDVLFLGYRSDVSQLLTIIDIFCLPSLKEGLPISLIEAMAAGLPVVGTDADGIRDVIIPNKNGFLVSIHDVERLKKKLLTLIKDESLRHVFGRESKLLAKDLYSLKHCVKQYEKLFISMAG